MAQQGLCKPSKSSWANPLHLVQKKNSDWRFYGDYSKINEVISPDHYSSPFLQNTHFLRKNIFHSEKLFSTTITHAYRQIQSVNLKTAIITPFEFFEFSYMTFGLHNAAQTFHL